MHIESADQNFQRTFSRRQFVIGLTRLTTGGLILACGSSEERTIENLALFAHDETRQIELDPYEQQLVALTNSHRIYRDIKPMLVDSSLVEVARFRCNDMASKNYFSHQGPDGKTVVDLMHQIKYPYLIAWENIASNNFPLEDSPRVAFDGLLKSPGHAGNMFDPKLTHFGVGDKSDREGMHYFVQIFAARII